MATNLSTLLGGGRAPTKVIENTHSDGGTFTSPLSFGKAVLSGALTANVLKTIVTFTGRFDLYLLSAATVDTTSRTIRLKVTVDGNAAFDATSSTLTVADQGIFAAAAVRGGLGTPLPQEGGVIRCNESIVVEVASSLTETDKVRVNYVAHEVQ